MLDLGPQLRGLFAKEADTQICLILDRVAVHAHELCHIGLHHGLRLARVRIIEIHLDGDDIALARRARTNIARQGADRRRTSHLVHDHGHRLRLTLRRVEIVLLDKADEIAAAENLFTDLGDALLNLPGARRLDDVRRQVLGLDKQCRARPVYRRKRVGRYQAHQE